MIHTVNGSGKTDSVIRKLQGKSPGPAGFAYCRIV